MLRGNERKEIFLDDDRKRFLDTMERMKEDGNFDILAYCLMSNHVHILIREGKDSIQRSMKRIGISYVYYFNKKYHRIGHLFQDRYCSEVLEEDAYILAAARYIHNNPVKAAMVPRAEAYEWSSYKYERAVEKLKEFTKVPVEDGFIDCEETTGQAKPAVKAEHSIDLESRVNQVLDKYGQSLESLKGIEDKGLRDQILREIKKSVKASVRQLSKAIGISKDIIFRA
ncbi:MAG: transposase [Clostridiales bacterium]|jgi:REP element-mobilizing transposase RayT|nr:transposase [Eubacteriales bacterium]MDH7566731.1 transposase [Clostridiales bacterium]